MAAIYQIVDDDSNYSVRDSLYALPTVSVDQPVSDFDRSQFHGAFWASDTVGQNLEDGFEAMKRYEKQGSDFCKDISEIMRERAAIEDMYGKKLQQLHAKSAKVADNTYGSLKDAWLSVLNEFKERADWHLGLCDVMKKVVCDPLVVLEKQLRKDHKTIQAPVEKALKHLYEILGLLNKCKRTAHAKSKEAEIANVAVDEASQHSVSKGISEKDMARLAKTASATERLRDKADSTYRDSMDKAAHAQEAWETAMINGLKGFQNCEEERTQFFKKVFQEYSQNLTAMVPQMDKCLSGVTRSIDAISPSNDIITVCQERGTGPYVFIQNIYDCYEENMQNAMDRTRRRTILVDKVALIRTEVEKKEKMRAGLLKMWEATRDSVRDGKSDNRSLFAVTRQVIALDYGFTALFSSLFKLRCSLSDVAGAERPTSMLSHMIDRRDDKGLMASFIRIPLSFRLELDSLKREEASAAVVDKSFGQAMQPAVRRQTMEQTRAKNLRPSSNAPPPPSTAPPPPSTAPPPPSSSRSAPTYAPVNAAPPPPPMSSPPSTPSQAPTPLMPMQPAPPIPSQQQQQQQQQQEPDLPVLCRCRVLYDYEPAEEDELRLRVGDELDVADNSDDTWWQGTLRGRLGVFPAVYVQTI